MGLFSNLFKSKPKATAETRLGLFTFVYSKGDKNTWTNHRDAILLSVNGSALQPDPGQIKFLESWQTEVKKLDEAINKRLQKEFADSDLPVDFIHWKDAFKISSIDVMQLSNNKACWSISLEQLKDPFAHFNLFIEGDVITDVSLDT